MQNIILVFIFYLLRNSTIDSYSNISWAKCLNQLIGNEDTSLLMFEDCFAPILSRFAFVPQFGMIIVASVFCYKYINLALFLATFIFVTYNKVCTSQYFNWYIVLLPLIMPFLYEKEPISPMKLVLGCFKRSEGTNDNDMDKRRWLRNVLVCIGFWYAFNGNWLYWAYRFEILGEENQLLNVWLASIAFFVINNILIFVVWKCYRSRATWECHTVIKTHKS